MRSKRLGLVGGALLLAAMLAPRTASASGYSVARFGGEHGHPTTTNATAIYYNPAGIGMSEGIHAFVDVSAAWRRVTWEHSAAPTDDTSVDGANTGRAKMFNVLASPMLGVTGKFGDFAVGAGFSTPFGGQSTLDTNDKFDGDTAHPGPVDGIQRWYAISGKIQSSFITLAAAYEFPDAHLSVGLSGNLILSKIETLRAKTILSDNNPSASSEGRSYLDVSGVDFSMGAGVMWEAMPDQLWIGASYQSRPNFSGMKPLEGTLTTRLPLVPESVADVELDSDLPDVYRLGFRFRPEQDIELRLFGDYTRWSVLKRHCVYLKGTGCNFENEATGRTTNEVQINQPRDWKDTFGVRAGASVWMTKATEVYAGAGFSSNAVPEDTLEPALPDWDGVSLSAGGRFEIVDDVHLDTSYTQLIYFPRDNTGKSELPQLEALSKGPDTGGVYKQMVGVLNVNVDVAF